MTTIYAMILNHLRLRLMLNLNVNLPYIIYLVTLLSLHFVLLFCTIVCQLSYKNMKFELFQTTKLPASRKWRKVIDCSSKWNKRGKFVVKSFSLFVHSSHFKSAGCDSEEDLTNLVEKEKDDDGEVHEIIVTDIFRKVEKYIISRNLEELLILGQYISL